MGMPWNAYEAARRSVSVHRALASEAARLRDERQPAQPQEHDEDGPQVDNEGDD